MTPCSASIKMVLLTVLIASWSVKTANSTPTLADTRPSARSESTEEKQAAGVQSAVEFQREVGPPDVASPDQSQDLAVSGSYPDTKDRNSRHSRNYEYPSLNNQQYGGHSVEYKEQSAYPLPSSTDEIINNYLRSEKKTTDDESLVRYIVGNKQYLPQALRPAQQYVPKHEVLQHQHQYDNPSHHNPFQSGSPLESMYPSNEVPLQNQYDSPSHHNPFPSGSPLEPIYTAKRVKKIQYGNPSVPDEPAHYLHKQSVANSKEFYPPTGPDDRQGQSKSPSLGNPSSYYDQETYPGKPCTNLNPINSLRKYFRLHWNSSSIPLQQKFTVLEPTKFQQSLVDANKFSREYYETVYVSDSLTDLHHAKEFLNGDQYISKCNPCNGRHSIKAYPSKNDWFERFLECGKELYCPLMNETILIPCTDYYTPTLNLCNPCRRLRKLVQIIVPGCTHNEIRLPYAVIKTEFQTFYDDLKNRYEIVHFGDKNVEFDQCHGDTYPTDYDLSDVYRLY